MCWRLQSEQEAAIFILCKDKEWESLPMHGLRPMHPEPVYQIQCNSCPGEGMPACQGPHVQLGKPWEAPLAPGMVNILRY